MGSLTIQLSSLQFVSSKRLPEFGGDGGGGGGGHSNTLVISKASDQTLSGKHNNVIPTLRYSWITAEV
jgi:hypothetical protein